MGYQSWQPTSPEHATLAWADQAEALRLLGRHQEAREAATQIPEMLIISY